MAAYRRVDDLRSPAGWLPVHRDQLWAQRSVSSMGSLYLFYVQYVYVILLYIQYVCVILSYIQYVCVILSYIDLTLVWKLNSSGCVRVKHVNSVQLHQPVDQSVYTDALSCNYNKLFLDNNSILTVSSLSKEYHISQMCTVVDLVMCDTRNFSRTAIAYLYMRTIPVCYFFDNIHTVCLFYSVRWRMVAPCCQVTILSKLFTPMCLCRSQSSSANVPDSSCDIVPLWVTLCQSLYFNCFL